MVNSKDVDEKFGPAARMVKATYHYPYQMHGSFGTSCAVADVQIAIDTLTRFIRDQARSVQS